MNKFNSKFKTKENDIYVNKREANTDNLIKRIIEGNFWCLRDKQGNCLNVAYTKEGLEWTTDNVGRYLYGKEGTYAKKFIPKKEILLGRGYKTKCEKRACDKANAMMYEQRNI